MSENPDNLDDLLGNFIDSNNDTIGAALFTTSGMIIESAFSRNVKWPVISSMIAQVQLNAKKTIEELSLGRLKRIIIEGETGSMIISKIGNDIILCAIIKPDARLGMILLGLQTLVRNLSPKDHKPDESQKVIAEIFSIMEEKETDTLTFEKKYLPELFDNHFLQFDTEDGLPMVNINARIQLSIQGIQIKYDQDLVIFIKY